MSRHDLSCTCTDTCRQRHARYEKQRIHDLRHGRPRLVPALGTHRRLRALQAIGWRNEDIAAAAGWPWPSFVWLVTTRDMVRTDTAGAAVKAYRQLSGREGPSELSRSRAASRGYLPPIAWDDDALDDPAAVPWSGMEADTYDPVVLHRMMTGEPALGLSLPLSERLLLIDAWRAAGRPLAELDRVGWNAHRDLRWRAHAEAKALA